MVVRGGVGDCPEGEEIQGLGREEACHCLGYGRNQVMGRGAV